VDEACIFDNDQKGKLRRRKANFVCSVGFMVDDRGTKCGDLRDYGFSKGLSATIRTSGSEISPNYQDYIFFDKPCTDPIIVEMIQDALVSSNLMNSPGKDPGMKGVTRFSRLPSGFNNKTKYGSPPPKVELIACDPSIRYSVEEIAEILNIELYGSDYQRRQFSQLGAAISGEQLEGHPIIQALVKAEMFMGFRSNGWHHIRCPKEIDHTSGITGCAVFIGQGMDWRIKCHHGAHGTIFPAHLIESVFEKTGLVLQDPIELIFEGRLSRKLPDIQRVQSNVDLIVDGGAIVSNVPKQAPKPHGPGGWEIINAQKGLSFDEILERKPVEYTIDGFLAKNLAGFLSAEGGVGKTSYLLDLMIHIAGRRSSWMGMTIRSHGKVYLLSQDDNYEDLKATMSEIVHAMRNDMAKDDFVEFVNYLGRDLHLISYRDSEDVVELVQVDGNITKKSLAADNIRNAIQATIDIDGEMARPVMVAFDTLRTFLGGSANDDRVISVATKAMGKMANDLQTNVVVTHHLSKQGNRSGGRNVDDMSGSKAISDNSRFVWLLRPVKVQQLLEVFEVDAYTPVGPDDTLFELNSGRGSIRVPAPRPFFMKRNGYNFSRVLGRFKSGAEKAEDRTEEYLSVIEQLGKKASINGIRQQIGLSKEVVLAEITKLIDAKLLVRVGNKNSPNSYIEPVQNQLINDRGNDDLLTA